MSLPKTSKYVFTLGSKQLTIQKWNKEIKERCHMVGIIKDIAGHAFSRHSYITNQIDAGHDMMYVAQVVNQNIATTQRYFHASPERLRQLAHGASVTGSSLSREHAQQLVLKHMKNVNYPFQYHRLEDGRIAIVV